MNDLTCNYCNKEFSRKDVLNRHIKSYCKNKKILDETTNAVKILLEQHKQIINELTELKEINNELIDKNNNLSNKHNELVIKNNELLQLSTLCQVRKGKNKNIKTNNNSHNINVANTANINAHTITNDNSIDNKIDNSITNNYIINKTINFGSEDLSKLSESEILGVLKTLSNVFPSFVKTVHANEKYPEFSNLKIVNKRSNYGFMMEEGKFVTKTFAQITDELINTRLPELEQYARDYRDQKKINLREYNVIKKTLDFLKNTYIETEDIDGNIVKGDKNDVKKLKNELGNVINAMYDNRETILSNIDKCAKGSDNKQIKLITNV